MTTRKLPALAERLRRGLRRLARPAWTGYFRTQPLSNEWGLDRGTPVDRVYIDQFLAHHRRDVGGRVLEVRDSNYTTRFGNAVTAAEVLDVDPTNPLTTRVADLAAADEIPADTFDCIILTQTLQFIPDVPAAVRHTHRMLKPGGVLLCTVPSVSRLAPRYGLERDYWRFTPASCRVLFGERFGPDRIEVRGWGNVLAGVAFLMGMAAEELSERELNRQDDYFPLIVTVRAVKAPRA